MKQGDIKKIAAAVDLHYNMIGNYLHRRNSCKDPETAFKVRQAFIDVCGITVDVRDFMATPVALSRVFKGEPVKEEMATLQSAVDMVNIAIEANKRTEGSTLVLGGPDTIRGEG